MRLNTISDKAGARSDRKRVGRGAGSGIGRTGGRGMKGQKSRSGVAVVGFEGGQMPIYRRLPKRGFNKPNRADWNEVNIGRIQAAIDAKKLDAKKVIDLEALIGAGLISKPRDGVRLLGKGEFSAKAKFAVDHATKAATAAVEKAGGSIEIVDRTPKPAAKSDAG
jgi:large subunit ribosomal protein L15